MKKFVIGITALAAFATFEQASASGPAVATYLKSVQFAHAPARRPAYPGAYGARVREDCVSFNNATVRLRRINGRWKIVDGSHWIADFGGNAVEAKRAYRIVKFYRFDQQCFVGRPGPSMTYWKSGGGVPGRSMPGQDCVGFDPNNIQVRNIGGRWKIVEGSHWIADFGGRRQEAFQAFNIIKRYRMSKQCFVGRPGPSMTYWLR